MTTDFVLDRYFIKVRIKYFIRSNKYYDPLADKNRNGNYDFQVRDENKEAEYLCLSHNPFADFIAVGTENGTIKIYDEKTLQVSPLLIFRCTQSKHRFLLYFQLRSTVTRPITKAVLQVVSLLKKSLSSSKVDGHVDRVFAIANHPTNAHEFVSSGWDNTLQVS